MVVVDLKKSLKKNLQQEQPFNLNLKLTKIKRDLEVKITRSLKRWKEWNKHRVIRKKYEKGNNPEKEFLTCDTCDYQYKKKNTLNKHIYTKHEPQVCKVCDHKSQRMVDMLKNVADKHSKKSTQVKDIKEQHILKEHQEYKEVIETLEYDKFKCYKFRKMFLTAKILKTFIEDSKNMCNLCTILSYGED